MLKPASEMTQDEINHFCRAASAVYFAIARAHAARTGGPVLVPDLICPAGRVPCVGQFDDDLLDEAELFLLRMGMIGRR